MGGRGAAFAEKSLNGENERKGKMGNIPKHYHLLPLELVPAPDTQMESNVCGGWAGFPGKSFDWVLNKWTIPRPHTSHPEMISS